MVWVRLDDHFDQNPKIAQVGPLGMALWVTGLAYCNRNMTDGFIPWTTARALLSWEYLDPHDPPDKQRIQTIGISSGMSGKDIGSSDVIELLLLAGLWEVDERGGYLVHDYEQFQPLKEQVESERRASAERTAKSRQNSQQRSTVSNTASNTVTDGAPVPDPVPLGSKEPRHTRAKVVPFLTEDERARLVEKHAPKYGAEFTDRELTFSLSHESALKVKTDSWFVYCDRWMSRQERYGAPSNGSTPAPSTTYAHLSPYVGIEDGS